MALNPQNYIVQVQTQC